MSMLTFAVCTYNRADRLPRLIGAMRDQHCPLPYEIVVVDNNSTDNTQIVLHELSRQDGVPVHIVRECHQGISHARNRAINESLNNTYMIFIDDDEIPMPGFLDAAVDAFESENAECVGGRVHVIFEPGRRPHWLGNDLLPFLAEVDYGDEPFWLSDDSTPLWTANIGYRMSIFRNDSSLSFDSRYNRKGKAVGGGEDVLMFNALLERGVRMRYRPDMIVEHHVETWRLKRSYFLKLHYTSGFKKGRWELDDYPRSIYGIPPFLLRQALRHGWKTLLMYLRDEPGKLRQAMNGAHAFGMMAGRFQNWRESRTNDHD